MNNQTPGDDWEISTNAIAIVAAAHCASVAEVQRHIEYIEEKIGTGYYDGSGDVLLGQIVEYLVKFTDN